MVVCYVNFVFGGLCVNFVEGAHGSELGYITPPSSPKLPKATKDDWANLI